MSDYLIHHGILGQKWGVRRYQNPDGSLTAAGRKRYGDDSTKEKDPKKFAKGMMKRLNDVAKATARNQRAFEEEYEYFVKYGNKANREQQKAMDSSFDSRKDAHQSKAIVYSITSGASRAKSEKYEKLVGMGEAKINGLIKYLEKEGYSVTSSDHKYHTGIDWENRYSFTKGKKYVVKYIGDNHA